MKTTADHFTRVVTIDAALHDGRRTGTDGEWFALIERTALA